MIDYTPTFDYWWYFYHRLQNGDLAQWNPFSLLGRINVQWNYIPVSIFSPFLALKELSLEDYHKYQIASTFLATLAIYLIGRLSGYGRFLPLIPVLFIFTSGYKYWASFLHFSTLLFFFPLAIVTLLSTLDYLFKYFLFIIFLSLSFLGCRMEKMVYALGFILTIFFVKAWCHRDSWPQLRKHIFLGIGSIVIVLAANAWQLSFLINSTLENYRIREVTGFPIITNPLFFKYVLASIGYQPILFIVVLNFIILQWLRRTSKCFSETSWVWLIGFAGLELLILKQLIQYKLNTLRIAFTPSQLGSDIVFSNFGIATLLFLIAGYLLTTKKKSVANFLIFFSVLLSGVYISEYSWGKWPLHLATHSFFWIPWVAALIPIGAVSLWLKNKSWIVVVLVVYHFVGETGAFFLFEIIGLPWLAPRAALMEIPFQVILLLEAVTYSLHLASVLLSKIFKSFASREIENKLGLIAKTSILIFAFWNIEMFLLPEITTKDQSGKQYYTQEFPFAETAMHELSSSIKTSWIQNALLRSKEIRSEYGKKSDPLKRVPIEDSVLEWTEKAMYYKFLPAYSQTLNTAPLYSSEIPRTMKYVFSDSPGKEIKPSSMPHPEMNPLFSAFRNKFQKTVYTSDLLIRPHAKNDPVFNEILALEGSKTPRAFLTKNVVKFDHYYEEYTYLSNILKDGKSFMTQVTTSDKQFSLPSTEFDELDLPFLYNLEFAKNSPENIQIIASSESDGYLVLLDLWAKGWKSFIDNEETTVYRGYMGTRFIHFPKGNHLIEFKYRVPGIDIALVVSAISWLFLFTMLAVKHRKNKTILQ